MRNKQYLTAIRPLDGVLAMSTMRFADEVVPRSRRSTSSRPRGQARRQGAEDGRRSSSTALAADWKPEQYHDTYAEELRKRIKAKTGRARKIVDEAVPPSRRANVVDLMAALEASLKKAKRPRRTHGEQRDEERVADADEGPPRDLSQEARLRGHLRAFGRNRTARRSTEGSGSSCNATGPAACTTTSVSRTTACS